MPSEPSLQIRSILSPDDHSRMMTSVRRDLDRPNYSNRPYTPAAQPTTPNPNEMTPPRSANRSRPRYNPHTPGRTIQEVRDCISIEQTIELFRSRIEEARKEAHHVLADTVDGPNAIMQTLTIDLGRERIERLPDAVIELIVTDVERLSLSHNYLRYMPPRISDCKQLRYLNIRSNDLKEIPPPLFNMPFLEILDLSKNKINMIPPEIKQLETLRVFSIVYNRLVDLPLELADMPRLKVFKVAENPFREGIKKTLQAKEAEVAFSEMAENERDTALTTELLAYLRSLKPLPSGSLPAASGSSSESLPEISRPSRRALSGRFPVVPAASMYEPLSDPPENGAQLFRPPNLPTKSHLRGMSSQSGQSTASKRPGIAPVVVSGNERNRSNSESVIQASAAARQKRMGIMRRERTELDSIDETKVARHSHLRGFSHGSALRRTGSFSSPGATSSSPNSPKDVRKDRTQYVRRLSSLPEYKTNSNVRRPLMEGSKSILYALYQVHPLISGLISASKGHDARRSGLEMSFYNASVHVDKLNKSLEQAALIDPEDEESWDRAQTMINNDCGACIKSFVHVVSQMQERSRKIVAESDPRYIRSLMLLLYGSVVEIRNAIKSFGIELRHHRRQMSSGQTYLIQTIPEEPSSAPATPQKQQRPFNRDTDGMTLRQNTRLRSDTVLQHPATLPSSLQPVQPPPLIIPNNNNPPPSTTAGSYSRTSSAGAPNSVRSFVARSRSNSRSTTLTMQSESQSSTVASTPRSTESYHLPPIASLNSRLNPETGMTDAQEETRFESIFVTLTRAYESALHAIPIVMKQFQRCVEAAEEQKSHKEIRNIWLSLVQRSKTCLDLTQALQLRLTHMKLKDSGVGFSDAGSARHDTSFWQLCKAFLQGFVDLVTEMKEIRGHQVLTIPSEIVAVLKPVQKACRDAGHSISTSPWNNMFQGVNGVSNAAPLSMRSVDSTKSPQMGRQAVTAGFKYGVNGGLTDLQQTNQAQQSHTIQPLQHRTTGSTSSMTTPVSAISQGSNPSVAQISATPMSAALGTAVQATVPSTPATTSTESFFKGDVFQRAASLLSMQAASGTVNFLNRRG